MTGLPAGTPCMFGVRAGGNGGWSPVSDPSTTSIARTLDTDYSRECQLNLNKNREPGNGLSGGEIAAIVIGCVAAVVLVGVGVFMIQRRAPPPPPPEFKAVPPS